MANDAGRVCNNNDDETATLDNALLQELTTLKVVLLTVCPAAAVLYFWEGEQTDQNQNFWSLYVACMVFFNLLKKKYDWCD